MESVTIFLTYPAAANDPFTYRIGDRFKSPARNIQGTVKNAKYAGPEYVGPLPCWITYYLETDNGRITQIPQTELEEITAD